VIYWRRRYSGVGNAEAVAEEMWASGNGRGASILSGFVLDDGRGIGRRFLGLGSSTRTASPSTVRRLANGNAAILRRRRYRHCSEDTRGTRDETWLNTTGNAP
jgi:hypothetical protein